MNQHSSYYMVDDDEADYSTEDETTPIQSSSFTSETVSRAANTNVTMTTNEATPTINSTSLSVSNNIHNNNVNNTWQDTNYQRQFAANLMNTRQQPLSSTPSSRISTSPLHPYSSTKVIRLIETDPLNLVGKTLKIISKGDTSSTIFKNTQIRCQKMDFNQQFASQMKDEQTNDEDASFAADMAKFIDLEMSDRSTTIIPFDEPVVQDIGHQGTTATFSVLEATKLFSLNMGLERAFKTPLNDPQFEVEFAKLFFSVYGEEDVMRMNAVIGKIIEMDLLKER